jgi:hypothetical protein
MKNMTQFVATCVQRALRSAEIDVAIYPLKLANFEPPYSEIFPFLFFLNRLFKIIRGINRLFQFT